MEPVLSRNWFSLPCPKRAQEPESRHIKTVCRLIDEWKWNMFAQQPFFMFIFLVKGKSCPACCGASVWRYWGRTISGKLVIGDNTFTCSGDDTFSTFCATCILCSYSPYLKTCLVWKLWSFIERCFGALLVFLVEHDKINSLTLQLSLQSSVCEMKQCVCKTPGLVWMRRTCSCFLSVIPHSVWEFENGVTFLHIHN